jgi:hypothetical protein
MRYAFTNGDSHDLRVEIDEWLHMNVHESEYEKRLDAGNDGWVVVAFSNHNTSMTFKDAFPDIPFTSEE